jgi:hypothetical protein
MKLIGTSLFIIGGLLFWNYMQWPWYGILIIPFVSVLVIFPKWKWAFVSALLSGTLVWGFSILPKQNKPLVEKMSELLSLPNASLLVFGTILLGGLLSSVGASFGWSIRKSFEKKQRKFR